MMKSLPWIAARTALGVCAVGVAWGLPGLARAGDLELPSVIPAPAYKVPTPVVRSYNWSGFYIGGNVGGHWGVDKITTVTDVGPPGFEGGVDVAAAAIDAASPVTLMPQGFIGGGQVGAQIEGSFGVFGVEIDAASLGGTATRALRGIPGISPADVLSDSMQASFLSTLRMRWGTAALNDRLLLFITAGFAFETMKTTDSMGHFGNTVITTVTGSTTQPGLAAGVGFEYAFVDNWSVKFEYLFINVKGGSVIIPATAGNSDSIAVNHDYTDNIARIGLNYRLVSW
jgi:outer membrane immunogenic protein